MKTLKLFCVVAVLCLFTGFLCNAQNADVTVVIGGIKDVKGKIMIAIGDQSSPQGMKYDMVEVVSTDNIVCILKGVPVGKCGLYVYQDINENNQLDKDENRIPVEPCYIKEKIIVKEEGLNIDVKLMNMKEMMGKR